MQVHGGHGGAVLTAEQRAWRRKWSKALRSGKYKQGKGRLKDSEGRFCCLGVACDLADPKGWCEGWDAEVVFGRNGYSLSDRERTLFGVSSEDEGDLMSANDGWYVLNGQRAQFSFEEIADVIDYMTLGGV